LIEPVATASWDISAKIVVPRPARRGDSGGRRIAAAWHGTAVTDFSI
jgi:hypothetical protein